MAKKIVIDGVIGWEITAQSIRRQLDSAKGKDVTIEISSPGGSVFEGLEIFNLIRDYTGNVKSKITGLAASMASYIALAADTVTMHDNAVFMIHNPWAFTLGDYNELRKEADVLEGLAALLSQQYAKKTGKPVEEMRSLMDVETWLFGSEIKDAGFADDIIESEKTETAQDKNTEITKSKAIVAGCLRQMKASEEHKDDLEKAAAMLPKHSQEKAQASPYGHIERKHKEVQKGDNKMTIEELKAQHPDIYAAVFALGESSAREDIACHAVYFDDAPDLVIAAIKENKTFSKLDQAKYNRAGANKNDIAAAIKEDGEIGDLKTPTEDSGNKIFLDTVENGLNGQSMGGDE